ncbi:hypothetical protein BT93_E1694 [Corymbia citriodora subsp. variegata]|nr:hypothetical protein BT93_E1694 [Corymbia citriodora subsp. variegata]
MLGPCLVAIVAALVSTFLLIRRRKAPRLGPDSRDQMLQTTILADAASPGTESTNHGPSGTKYEVFLSFRGPDTRATFTDSLYHTLLDKGISVFIDKQGIDVGEEIGPEIFQAIDDSKICIPIFSRDYASSSWCLRELEHMMQRRKTNELEVMPIFYDVEPSDVKLETRVYADALTLHKKKRGAEIVQCWEEALKEVTRIKGWDAKSAGHGKLPRLIARKVLIKLKVSCVHISDHLVGMDESVDRIVDLLDVESKDVRLIGIWGMGGIGKTTLAKAVYNKLSTNFDGCSFISNVREASQGSGLLNFQSQLVSNIFGDIGVGLSSIDHGKNMIKNRFCRKKVIIFLDDVDREDQLTALAAKKDWFGLGSRIVVTTRNKSVFLKFQDQFDYCLIHEVKELNSHLALQLFSKHAFRSNSPPNAFLSLSEKIIAKAGGLPLAIEVIGSFLCGKKEELVWQDTLKKMKYFQQKDVQQRLMLSYEALDHPQQQIFLDIACFLAGHNKSYPCYMWDDCGFFPNEGIDVLLLVSLVKIGEDNQLWMHDQLKDLGMSIVYEEYRKDPTKGTRLWLQRGGVSDIFQQKGTKTVAAQYRRLQPPPQVPVLTSEELNKMPNIRFLYMRYCTLSGDFGHLFSELRWLTWWECPEEMQATNFCPKNLVILDLWRSNIDECWGGWTQLKVATKLKVLDLTECTSLKETPELSAFLSLEILILEGCKGLTKLSDSIGMLKYITKLDVSNTSIVELPNTIVNLKSLKVLRMNNSCIQKLPEAIGMMEKLEEIYGEHCRLLEMFPSDIVRLPSLKILKLTVTCVDNVPELPPSLVTSRLEVLDLSDCRMLKETLELSAFLSLKVLILKGCKVLTRLSNSIEMLKHLAELDVSDTSIAELPNSIVNLKSLKVLRMNNSCIQKLPKAIGMMEKLEKIYGNGCKRLEMIPCDIHLESLCLSSHVSENNWMISNLVVTKPMDIHMPHHKMVKQTSELYAFLSLKVSILKECEDLTKLFNSIGMLKYITELDVSNTSIAELPNTIVNLKSLKVLRMNSSYIQKLPEAIGMMEKLEEIYGEHCRLLEMFPSDIVRLPSLKILKLTGTCVDNVPELPPSLVATRLEVLNLSDCRMLKETLELSPFVSIKVLILKGCRVLTRLSNSIEMLKYLVELDVSNTSIVELPNAIINLKNLKVLKINDSRMQKLPEAIGMMEKLEEIYGERCMQLEMIPSDIKRLPILNILKLTGTRLKNVPKLPQSLVCLCLSSTVSEKDPEISNLVDLINLELCFPLTYINHPTILERAPAISNLYCKLELSIITSISSYLGCFRCLEELELENCNNLRYIGSLPSDLRIFAVYNCRFLEVVDLSNLSDFKNLEHLKVQGCPKLVEIQDLDRLESLEYLYIEHCSPLLCLPDLSNWKELKKWDVDALATYLARGKEVARSDDLPL